MDIADAGVSAKLFQQRLGLNPTILNVVLVHPCRKQLDVSRKALALIRIHRKVCCSA